MRNNTSCHIFICTLQFVLNITATLDGHRLFAQIGHGIWNLSSKQGKAITFYQRGPFYYIGRKNSTSKTADANLCGEYVYWQEAYVLIPQKICVCKQHSHFSISSPAFMPPFKATVFATLHLFSSTAISSFIRSYHLVQFFHPFLIRHEWSFLTTPLPCCVHIIWTAP